MLTRWGFVYIIAFVAILLDVAAGQTRLFSLMQLTPAWLIAVWLVCPPNRTVAYLSLLGVVSAVWALSLSINPGLLLISWALAVLVGRLASGRKISILGENFGQILLFFYIWGVLLFLTKGDIDILRLVAYGLINTVIGWAVYKLISRSGLFQEDRKSFR